MVASDTEEYGLWTPKNGEKKSHGCSLASYMMGGKIRVSSCLRPSPMIALLKNGLCGKPDPIRPAPSS